MHEEQVLGGKKLGLFFGEDVKKTVAIDKRVGYNYTVRKLAIFYGMPNLLKEKGEQPI